MMGAAQIRRRLTAAVVVTIVAAPAVSAIGVSILTSSGAVPSHIAGRFREPTGFQQAASGEYLVFDRRAHTVYGIDRQHTAAREIVRIGAEAGRIIDATAFAVEPDGSFVVADSPNGRERIQIFSRTGLRIGGFLLPGRLTTRVVLDNMVLNGIGSLQYTGTSILMSQPETGGLIAEFELDGSVHRTIGSLRRTGHEADRDLHLALNSGLPLVDPTGGFYFVFQTGAPMFRKYDSSGRLVFERHVEGREIDAVLAALPTVWPRRRTSEGEIPLVTPSIRSAAVDHAGNLWISFVTPFTYVYDRDGDKTRVVQFRGAGVVTPTSLFFTNDDRLLIAPGLYEFHMRAGGAGGAGQAGRTVPDLPIRPIPPVPPIQPMPLSAP